jgi:hypothetical protein
MSRRTDAQLAEPPAAETAAPLDITRLLTPVAGNPVRMAGVVHCALRHIE